MYLRFAIPAFLILRGGSATSNSMELDPKYEMYQDASKAFPLTEAWHIMYRNFEEDPAFGTSKCVRFTLVPPEQEDGFPAIAEYGEGESATGLITLESGEGYTVKNKIVFHPEGQDTEMLFYLTFLDNGNCAVNRNAYVNDDACCVLVPDSRLGMNSTSCDFVYDLLCGSTKYEIYDDSCKA